VHATIAGVAMGLMLRCSRREGETRSPGEQIEHLVRPFSAAVAVPLFALFAAGVSVSGGALGDVFSRPETLGVVLGLVVGKAAGIFGGTWLAARFTRAELNKELAWPDVFAVSALAGIGFTVSLLIGELAFAGNSALTSEIKASVLLGSLIAAVLSSVLLKSRNRTYRLLGETEKQTQSHAEERPKQEPEHDSGQGPDKQDLAERSGAASGDEDSRA
jgi:NhaA family Na+:H+ antiporter